MKKYNGQEIGEVDDCPGIARVNKRVIDAACNAALVRRGVHGCNTSMCPRRTRAQRRREKEGR